MYAAEYLDTKEICKFFKYWIAQVARNVSPISEIISDGLPFSPISEWFNIGFLSNIVMCR
jgi:hypothetical protein